MGRFFFNNRGLDGHVKEPYEMSMALRTRPYVQTSSFRLHICVPPGESLVEVSSVSQRVVKGD